MIFIDKFICKLFLYMCRNIERDLYTHLIKKMIKSMSGNSITGELAIIYFSCVFACVYLCGFGCGCHYLHFKDTYHSYILVVKLCNFTVKQKDKFYSCFLHV